MNSTSPFHDRPSAHRGSALALWAVLVAGLGSAACGGQEASVQATAPEKAEATAPAVSTPWQISEAALAAARDGEWSQFRGAQREGISGETGLLAPWPAGGPKVRWRVPLGEGYSGISVAAGRVLTQYQKDSAQWLGAFAVADGKPLWKLRLDGAYSNSFGDGPRSTPTVDGSVVYALSALGKLYAVEAASGKVLWTKDLVQEVGARVPEWGVSTSPLVEGDLLLVDAGGTQGRSVIALNKATGEKVWAAGDDGAGYSAPIAFTAGGQRQAVFFTAKQLISVDPASGQVLWTYPWKTSYDVNAATPIFIPPSRLFVSSGYDTGAALLELRPGGRGLKAEQVWKSRGLKNQFSSSVRVGPAIYGFDNKTLKAVDLATGEDLWRERGFDHGSLIYADGHLVILSERGRLALVEASATAFQEKGAVQIFEGKCWTAPSLAGGSLYLRDEKELVSLDLKAP
jgi:outer membrane protein assembly factor BamB